MKRRPFSRTANDAPFAIRGRPIAEPRYEASYPRAVLLDLGGVIIDIDLHACFRSWACAADVEVGAISRRWAADDAYKAFEVGAIDFNEYLGSVSRRLGVILKRRPWRIGGNEMLRGLMRDLDHSAGIR